MKLEALTPMLRTWDLPGTLAFYRDVLGFTCNAASEEWGWASLARDSVEIMLASPNQHVGDTAPAFTGSLYFRTDDVEALWRELRDRARVCYPLETFDYGMREFAIYDPNGYLLQFGQPVAAGHDVTTIGPAG
ncbi:MAG TPA: VOC family protein [Thermoanaerobaculia bacterium]|nr:VOC family protein [Thermoanaerobaculia bacterium]